jgi:hypothetical protein
MKKKVVQWQIIRLTIQSDISIKIQTRLCGSKLGSNVVCVKFIEFILLSLDRNCWLFVDFMNCFDGRFGIDWIANLLETHRACLEFVSKWRPRILNIPLNLSGAIEIYEYILESKSSPFNQIKKLGRLASISTDF